MPRRGMLRSKALRSLVVKVLVEWAMSEEAPCDLERANESLTALEQADLPRAFRHEASCAQLIDPAFHHDSGGIRRHQLVSRCGTSFQAHHQRDRHAVGGKREQEDVALAERHIDQYRSETLVRDSEQPKSPARDRDGNRDASA